MLASDAAEMMIAAGAMVCLRTRQLAGLRMNGFLMVAGCIVVGGGVVSGLPADAASMCFAVGFRPAHAGVLRRSIPAPELFLPTA